MIARGIEALLGVYSLILMARILVSWLPVDANNPLVRFLDEATAPVLRPIRSVLPATGPLDFSPLVALLLLQLLKMILVG